MSKILGAGSAYAAAKEMPYCSNMSISANLVVEMVEHIAKLEKAIRYSSDYLDDNKLNSIGSGSKAHVELREALKEQGE